MDEGHDVRTSRRAASWPSKASSGRAGSGLIVPEQCSFHSTLVTPRIAARCAWTPRRVSGEHMCQLGELIGFAVVGKALRQMCCAPKVW
jgi:hypothetical protein